MWVYRPFWEAESLMGDELADEFDELGWDGGITCLLLLLLLSCVATRYDL